MNELAFQKIDLPDNIKDLSKFILVGREKLTSVRAEIRAINKLELAEEVRNQKKEEAQMLSEALLDAEVRLGDLLKQIPKEKNNNKNGRNQYSRGQKDTTVQLTPKDKNEIQNKTSIISSLGFSEKQAQRFETLANNKDLVEQVKAEARENDDIPTRGRVLDLAKARQQKIAENPEGTDPDEYIEFAHKVAKQFLNVIYAPLTADITDEKLQAWLTTFNADNTTQSMICNINRAIESLSEMRTFLVKNRRP